MRNAERILLMASILLVSLGTANASLWRHRKTEEKPAQPATTVSAMTLNAVEVDGSRVVLHTCGTPAYTSYSPSPTVFVVDLTATSKGPALAIPSALPSGIASLTAEEVTEMGSKLTRVTFRISDTQLPQVAPAENTLVVTLPASLAHEDAPAVAVATVIPEKHAQPKAEPIPEPARVIPEPVVITQAVPANKASVVKSIDATGSGDSLQIRITGDGSMSYRAFPLANPARLVIDVAGVKNVAKKTSIAVDDATVKRVRVAQFKAGADPVTRVVVDLASKSDYNVMPDGAQLRVTFGSSAIAAKMQPPAPTPAITVTEVVPDKAAPSKTEVAPAGDIPSQVPTVAENASTWKMPDSASKGAKSVITSADQATPPTPRPRAATTTPSPSTNVTVPGGTPGENVFETTPQPDRGQMLTGTMPSRTLSPGQRVYTGDPISLNLKDADIKDVLRTFAQLTGLNIAVDPNVAGSVTVDFVDVPWDQALDLILRQNGLTYVLEG
ncbi:MAG: AMIN domain-containing protein, partial [Thermoanaerobaculia bacterium]